MKNKVKSAFLILFTLALLVLGSCSEEPMEGMLVVTFESEPSEHSVIEIYNIQNLDIPIITKECPHDGSDRMEIVLNVGDYIITRGTWYTPVNGHKEGGVGVQIRQGEITYFNY